MKDYLGKHLVNLKRILAERILGSLLKTDCCDVETTGGHKDYSCACNTACATQGFQEEGLNLNDEPSGHTLQSLSAGETAYVKELCLPPALKKRVLSMGLTYGTKIAVVNKERGRMIVTVRDSRLGLSPEMAAKITYETAWEGV